MPITRRTLFALPFIGALAKAAGVKAEPESYFRMRLNYEFDKLAIKTSTAEPEPYPDRQSAYVSVTHWGTVSGATAHLYPPSLNSRREIALIDQSPMEFGREIASQCAEYGPLARIIVVLPPDTFHKWDDRPSVADMIGAGIIRRLPDTEITILRDYSEENRVASEQMMRDYLRQETR